MAELEVQYLQEQKDREYAETNYENKIKDLETIVVQTKEKTDDKLQQVCMAVWEWNLFMDRDDWGHPSLLPYPPQMEEKMAGLQDFAARRAEIEEQAKAESQACQQEKENAKAMIDDMERKCIRAKEALRKGKR